MGRQRLCETATAHFALDAELLLAMALDQERAYLIAHAGDPVSPAEEKCYLDLVEKRAQGVPLQYIRGRQEFWGRDFVVTPDVLIPRPETELIVEHALRLFTGWMRKEDNRSLGIADIGCGSGCLAVTLAAELQGARVFATDISASAIEVARTNAERNGVAGKIEFLVGDLGAPLLEKCGPESFDLLVCNPPYGAESKADLFEPEVIGFEPHEALFGGFEGTETIQRLMPQVHELLAPNGVFLMEMGIGQSRFIGTALFGRGWSQPEVYADLQGIPRCLCARKRVSPEDVSSA